MAEAPKKRAWFQIHLSTAIVLMFIAGILIYLNLQPWPIVRRPLPPMLSTKYGWPFYARCWFLLILDSEEAALEPPNGHVHWLHLVADAFIALSILVVVAVILEWRLRRKRFEIAEK